MNQFRTAEDKAAFVDGVFTNIAPKYDLLNKIISFNQDSLWRREAVKALKLTSGSHIIDVACGTCKITCEALKQMGTVQVTALDFNTEMIEMGQKKVESMGKADQVYFCKGNAMYLPYGDNTFDGAISGFALRNVPNVQQVLREMKRVVKPGGRVVILELAKPEKRGFKELHNIYFNKIMPQMVKIFGVGNDYTWLSESWKLFMCQDELAREFEKAGLENVSYKLMNSGVVAIHVGYVGMEDSELVEAKAI